MNILQSPRIGSEGRFKFVLESLKILRERKAFKNFTSEAPPETTAGVVFEESRIASRENFADERKKVAILFRALMVCFFLVKLDRRRPAVGVQRHPAPMSGKLSQRPVSASK